MTLDIASNVLSYNGKTISFDEAILHLASLSSNQISSFFNNREKKVPRKINMLALRSVLNDRVVHSKEIDLTDEQRYRLFCYPGFCDTQLQNFMRIVKTPELFKGYLEMLWKLILINYEVISLVDGEISYLMNLDSEGEPNDFDAFANGTTSIFSDRPGDFDGLEKNDFRTVTTKSSTLVELREIGSKYNLNIPRRLKKEELQAIIVEELIDMGKYDEETAQTLNIMSVLTMQRFAKKNGIKISIELKKEELVEYVLKQADKADLNKSEKFINVISLPEIDDFEFKNEYIEDIPAEPEPIIAAPIFEAPVAPEKKAPAIQFSEEDDFEEDDYDDDTEELIDEETGKVYIVHYKKSFNARYILSEKSLQENYTILKNRLLSYENVKSRVSWNYDSFNIGKQQIAKINVRAKILTLYLALNPKDFEGTDYNVTDASDVKRFEKVPTMISIFTDNDVRQAIELIAKLGLVQAAEIPTDDYRLPQADIYVLVEQGLAKKVVYDKETGLEIKPIDAPIIEEKVAEPEPTPTVVAAPIITPVAEEKAPEPAQAPVTRVETVYVQAPVAQAAPAIDAETLRTIIKETVTEIVTQTRAEDAAKEEAREALKSEIREEIAKEETIKEETVKEETPAQPQVIQQGLSVEDVKSIIREFAEANKQSQVPAISTEDIRYLVEGTVRQVVSQIVDKIPQPQAYAQPVILQNGEVAPQKNDDDDYEGFDFEANSTDATNSLFDGEIATKMNSASELALPKSLVDIASADIEEEKPELTPEEEKKAKKAEKKAEKKQKKTDKKVAKKEAKKTHKEELKAKEEEREKAYQELVAKRNATKIKKVKGDLSEDQIKAINAQLALAQISEIKRRKKAARGRRIRKTITTIIVLLILVAIAYYGMLVWYAYQPTNSFAKSIYDFSDKTFGGFHDQIYKLATGLKDWIDGFTKK